MILDKLDINKRRFIESNKIQKQNETLMRESIAQKYIEKLDSQGGFFPYSKFSLSFTNCWHILSDIQLNNKKTIVEFGSGYSTYMISKLINLKGLDIEVYSVDSDNQWLDFVKKEISNGLTTENIHFIHSNLIASTYEYGGKLHWYNEDLLNQLLPKKVDLILIDGPTAGLSDIKNSRFPAIPFLKPRIHNQTSIYLDDVNRPGEQNILKEWEKILNVNFQFLNRYAYFNPSSEYMSKPF